MASPAVPNDGRLGRFTVQDVELGDEGPKTITAELTDLYGNRAPEPLEVNINLDMTPPPVAFERIVNDQGEEGAQWDEEAQNWVTGLPRVRVVGRTDTTYCGARVRWGINEFVPDQLDTFPAGPGEPDSVRFRIPMSAPPLTPDDPEELVRYYVESFDEAGNVSSEPLDILWAAAGKETILSWDDSEPGSIGNYVSGQPGMAVAVMFQAPTWANFVNGLEIYIANDFSDCPDDPTNPSSVRPFTVWVWKCTADERPGARANEGYVPFGAPCECPENQLVEIRLPNAVAITSNQSFPDKKFFVGIEWQYRYNPNVGCDHNPPIDSRSFRWNWSTWEMQTFDIIIHAIVSDLETTEGGARTAVLSPVRVQAGETPNASD